jgi:hypothetical protein
MKPETFKVSTLCICASTTEASPNAYGIDLHIHRFAAWAASTAARTKSSRFSVEIGVRILEAAVPGVSTGAKAWPDPGCMDEFHRELRNSVIAEAARHGFEFSHGIAAKLINMYMKAALLSRENCKEPLAAALHPPIDSEMLNAIARLQSADKALWRRLNTVCWTNFSSSDYEAAIDGLRRLLGPNEPLWLAEQYWGGFTGAWRKRGKK